MYQIRLSKAGGRDIRKLSRQVQEELPKHFEILSADPRQGETLRGILQGLWKYEFSFGGSAYRIAYEILDNKKTVLVIMVGSRENFYNRLRRRI